MQLSGLRCLKRRRSRAFVSVWGTTKVHLSNPIIIALWSAIFPGMGHILLNKYFTGFILFIWEVIINDLSNLNEGIFYSFTGQFEAAKSVLDIRWLLFYCPMYIFTIWDSYRTSVNMNHIFVLIAKDDSPINIFAMNPLSINYLNKTTPWQSALWSFFLPGAGQLINHQIIIGFFLFGWWIVVVYLSNLLPAIHFMMQGLFEKSKPALNIQWVLNIPSIFFFCIYDAYINAVENNKLFEWEQTKFLEKQYQGLDIANMFHSQSDWRNCMYIVSTFEHDIKLETAINAVQTKGIPKKNIMAVPLSRTNDTSISLDIMQTYATRNMLDIPMILAALFALLGMIYGFLLTWGPVFWALIGTGLGFCIGLVLKLVLLKDKNKKQLNKAGEIVLIIQCQDNEDKMVQDTLLANSAMGIARLSQH